MAGTTDTIPAKLTPGEFVIKREAVDMIGVPFLNKLNNMPDEGGGHTEIDKLISMASMEGMKNMYGGGMVEMMGGGMVKNKMMGYGHGGMVKSPIMGMQKGGNVSGKSLFGAGSEFNEGVMDKDGDIFNYRRVISIPAEQVGGGEGLRFYAGEGRSDRRNSAMSKAFDDAVYKMAFAEQDSIPAAMIAEYLQPKKRSLRDLLPFQKGGMAKNLKPVPDDNPGLGKLPKMVRNRMGYMQDGGMVDDSLMGMMKGGMAKKKKGYGYQDGGKDRDWETSTIPPSCI